MGTRPLYVVRKLESMSLIRVKKKYQVTLPPKVRKAVNLRQGDLLDVEVRDGVIMLYPQSVKRQVSVEPSPEEKEARFNMLMSYLGAAKGLYASKQEIDDHIRQEREAWDN